VVLSVGGAPPAEAVVRAALNFFLVLFCSPSVVIAIGRAAEVSAAPAHFLRDALPPAAAGPAARHLSAVVRGASSLLGGRRLLPRAPRLCRGGNAQRHARLRAGESGRSHPAAVAATTPAESDGNFLPAGGRGIESRQDSSSATWRRVTLGSLGVANPAHEKQKLR